MDHQKNTLVIPSSFNVCLAPFRWWWIHNWNKTGDRSEGTTQSHHLREAEQTQAQITGEQHLPHPDSTFTQHIAPTHLPGDLLQWLTRSCLPVYPLCALSQSGSRHPTGSSRSHCYHAPTSSSGCPDKDNLYLWIDGVYSSQYPDAHNALPLTSQLDVR